MRVGSIKTAAALAAEHGQGILVVINGVEWRLMSLTVVDQPRDLQLCHGHTTEGHLVIFDAESVELVRIPPSPDGKSAALPRYPQA